MSRARFFLDTRASVCASWLDTTPGGDMGSILLAVPYESQTDNRSGTGFRECFSSSCAMLARFWQKVSGDDEYNSLRARFGDTTSPEAQLRTLRHLGLKAFFWTNGTRGTIEREISAGRPVALGWLHKGSAMAPSGGGHWSVGVGFTADQLTMHDPYGEPLMSTGGHIPRSSGRAVRCSWVNFLRRWEVDGPASGWYLTCSR